MKPTPAFSTPVSRTTTSSSPHDNGSKTSSKYGISKCIAGALRRLLCRSSIPTYPSDRFEYYEEEGLEESGESCKPGLMARLMGLDSLPYFEPVNYQQESPNSIARSRSMNSVESTRKLKSMQGKGRRSMSFREIPTYKALEDDNFFILSFEKGGQLWDLAMEGRKHIAIRGEKHEKEDKDEKQQCGLGHSGGGKSRKKKMVRRKDDSLVVSKLETEYHSENSSPNSVLDFVDFPHEPEASNSGNVSRLANPKTRRTLAEELKNYSQNPDLYKVKSAIKDNNKRQEKHGGSKKRNSESQGHVEKWDGILKLAERETTQLNWICKEIRTADECKEIGSDLAHEILDQLLDELNFLLESS